MNLFPHSTSKQLVLVLLILIFQLCVGVEFSNTAAKHAYHKKMKNAIVNLKFTKMPDISQFVSQSFLENLKKCLCFKYWYMF